MNLSRSESRTRAASMSMGRWLFVVVGFLLFVSVLIVIFVRSVNAGYRAEQQQAIALAMAQAGLTRIDEAVQYTWEEPVWVVRGRDRDNQTWIVWERKDSLVKEKETEYDTEDQIRERFLAEHATAESIRIVPGWLDNQPVWEIRYEDRAEGNGRPSIAFYAFKDGTMLKTYVLPGY